MPDTTIPNLPPLNALTGAELVWVNVNGLDYRITTLQIAMLIAQAVLNQQPTNRNFANSGAKINRMNDRLFVGGATANDGDFPNVQQDWLTQLQVSWGLGTGTIDACNTAILNNQDPAQAGGLLAGVEALNLNSGVDGIGLIGIAVNNAAQTGITTWGGYTEGHYISATGLGAIGFETAVRNTVGGIGIPNPYLFGRVNGLQVTAGAGLSAVGQVDCDWGIVVGTSGMKFKNGLTFQNGALASTVYGLLAVNLALNHQIVQWIDSTHVGMRIKGAVTVAANATGIVFDDNGMNVQDASNNNLFEVSPVIGGGKGRVTVLGVLALGHMSISALNTDFPAASYPYSTAFVTDSNVAAAGNFGNTLTAGGSTVCPAWSDGAAWRYG